MRRGSRLFLAWVVIALAAFILLKALSSHFKFHQSFFNPHATSQNAQLEKIVEKDLEGKPGTYGVYVLGFKNAQDSYRLNDALSFPAASLYKLVLLAAIYQEEEQGAIKPDDELTDTKTHLSQIYGGVDFGYEDSLEEISYSVSEAMDRVARLSDNFAAIMLTNKLKNKSELADLAKSLGMSMTNFSADPISTTPYDIGEFFRKLYNGQVVSKKVSDELITELEKDEINDRIPAGVPQDASGSAIPIAHKTGEFPGVRHDAGIIFLPNNPYVLVMMSKDLPYEDDGVALEAQLSKDIYTYFSEETSSGG